MAEIMAEYIRVQLAYATPTVEFLRDLQLAFGATVREAVEQSGLLQEVAGSDLATLQVGIYGKKKTLDTVLRENDRVEVYRPLLADPKESRRRRAGAKDPKH